jgi:hypothetical protein
MRDPLFRLGLLDWQVLSGVLLAGFSAHPLRAKQPMC